MKLLHNQIPTNLLADSTRASYLSIFNRTVDPHVDAFAGIHAVSTANKFRAAYRVGDRCMQEGVESNTEFGIAARKAILHFGGLENAESFMDAILAGDLSARVSRMNKLKNLPADWSEQMIEAAKCESSAEQAAVVAMAMVGPRPGEIADIGLLIMENGDLAMRLNGNKLSEVSGQCWRVFMLEPEGWAKRLLPLATRGKISYPFKKINSKRIQRVVAKASAKAFGCATKVNCSTFRNHVSSELKALDWSEDDIAKAMGHQSQKTQRFYGRRRFARKPGGWVPPKTVQTSQTTRPVSPSSMTYHLSQYAARSSDSHSVEARPTCRPC
jgi:hypothetical protein